MNIKNDFMNNFIDNIEVLMSKYIDNQVTEKEALTVLHILSQSKDLREVFCLAIAGRKRMNSIGTKSYPVKNEFNFR